MACGAKYAVDYFKKWRRSRQFTNSTVAISYPFFFIPAQAAGKNLEAFLLALNASTPPPGRPAAIPDVLLAKYSWIDGYDYSTVRAKSPTKYQRAR
jgi:hypothetical protein